MTRIASHAAALLLVLGPPLALAHGERPHAPGPKKEISTEEHSWGREGDPAKASKVVNIEMSDSMRFSPSSLTVKRGETVRFVIRNTGKVMHEMVLGAREDLERHAEMMRQHPGMEHEEPYQVHVSPGKRESMAWTFSRPGKFEYGCLIPGHWEAGMKGEVIVTE